jgi:peptidoglycan/xylan/chitin deacetylase (PgdA/CDA1 family)
MGTRQKIACITLDIEPDFGDRQRVRMFENEALLERYISIIQANQVNVTGFLVTSLLEPYGPVIERFGRRIPIEFGTHSHDHELAGPCSREQVAKSFRVYQDFWGRAPAGYRTPWGLIDRQGIMNLLDFGYDYDSSLYPSASFYPLRSGRKGYWNLHFPPHPFRVVRGQESLLELPMACLQLIRLVFSLSYIKLWGLGMYRTLMRFFPLPDIAVLLAHPYDYYIPLFADQIKGWERRALARNGRNAFDLFDRMIKLLKQQGYQFILMSELSRRLRAEPSLLQIPVEQWR